MGLCAAQTSGARRTVPPYVEQHWRAARALVYAPGHRRGSSVPRSRLATPRACGLHGWCLGTVHSDTASADMSRRKVTLVSPVKQIERLPDLGGNDWRRSFCGGVNAPIGGGFQSATKHIGWRHADTRGSVVVGMSAAIMITTFAAACQCGHVALIRARLSWGGPRVAFAVGTRRVRVIAREQKTIGSPALRRTPPRRSICTSFFRDGECQ